MLKIIWRDLHLFRFISLITWIPMFGIFVVWLLRDFTLSKTYNIVLMIISGLLWIYLLLGLLLPRATYITERGIRIGNVPNDVYTTIRIKQKPIFVSWKEMKEMKIIRKEVRHNFILVLRNFLILGTTDGKKYQTFLANPKGFKEALKQVKKFHLLIEIPATKAVKKRS